MKAFAIFPTVSIFILTFTVLRMNCEIPTWKNVLLSLMVASCVGGLLIIFSSEVFLFLYLSNFVFVLIVIPFLTFLINDYLPQITGAKLWIRLSGIGLFAILVTATLFGLTFYYALASNPMDP